MSDNATLNVSEGSAPEPDKQQTTTFNQVPDKETTVNEESNETTFNENVKETTVNELPRETKINEAQKEETKKTPQKEDETEKGGDGPEIERKPDDKEEDGDEDKGPFQEGDVIDYMYKDWLIGGANFLWTWTSKKIKTGYYRHVRDNFKRDAEKNKTRDLEKHEAYQWRDKYGNKALEESKKKTDKFENYNGLVELCDKIREGKVDETDLPEKTKTLIKNMPEKDFNKFFDKKRIQKCQDNMKDNMIAAMQFSYLYAATAMTDPKMQDKNFQHPNGNDNAFEQLRKEGLAKFAKALSLAAENGGNTTVLSGKLLSAAQKAFEAQDKHLKAGRFDGYAKKNNAWYRRVYRSMTGKKYGQPKQNKAWEELNNLLQGIDVNAAPANMLESMLMAQDFDQAISREMENLQSREYTEEARRINLENRRRQLEQARARIMNDPVKRQQRLAKEAQRDQKRDELRRRLSDPHYVSTGIDGKPDQQLTQMLRNQYGLGGGR